MLSQSDIIVRPGSLTERLAAAAPPQAEPTPTTMAERFAPEAQKTGGGDGPGRPPAEPPVMPGIVPERSRGGVVQSRPVARRDARLAGADRDHPRS